jgi:septum formation topological specificity factor MinE
LWAEMQNTLEDVELSATSGTHVFGPNHSKALEDLRTAQIALAQAWAKSEAEEELQASSNAKKGQDTPMNTADVLASDRQAKFDGLRTSTERSATDGKTQIEEETENDIALARERREANDKYFQRVNKGVVDVVQKLEEVALAMKGVEMESKEIWEKDSVDTASII